MSDELDRLRAEMEAATPSPDPARRADNLRRAAEDFAARQGSGATARPMSERGPLARLTKGVTTMLTTLTRKPALTATTALVAAGILLVVPLARDVLEPPGLAPALLESEAERRAKAEPDAGAAADNVPEAAKIGRGQAASAPEPAPRIAASEAIAPAETDADNAPAAAVRSRPAASPAPVPIAEPVVAPPEADTERFANAAENPLKVTAEDPVSTFSIDVDTASYAIVRSSLTAGRLPPPEAVRVEEMVNYFPYDYPAPEGEAPFRPTVTVMPTPWNPGTELVHIAIQGRMPVIAERPPLNLVFLVDTSGSMQDADKLPLLKQSLRLLLGELRPEDEVAIVAYAGSAGQVLAPTPARERGTILAALDRLESGGSTAGAEGIELAYRVAEGMAGTGELSRVILATDGDFNVGVSDPAELKALIEDKRASGTYLSVLGFGRGNLDDATMQALAQNGNGTAAYIDTLAEARKVLVDQLAGALFPIATDVKIQVEFNPGRIAEYRLIGYETRALRRQDFDNDRVDAGDIGAGHSVTALYEVTPVGSDAIRNGPLRYAEPAPAGETANELGFFRLRYKEPGEDASRLIEAPILPGASEPGTEQRFAAAIAGFGQLLRGGEYLGGWGWDEAIELATDARGEDRFGYRSEAITLMRLAQSLSR